MIKLVQESMSLHSITFHKYVHNTYLNVHLSRHITLCHTLAELAKVPEPKVRIENLSAHFSAACHHNSIHLIIFSMMHSALAHTAHGHAFMAHTCSTPMWFGHASSMIMAWATCCGWSIIVIMLFSIFLVGSYLS